MLSLYDIWDVIEPSPQIKIFWFETPEEAIKYLGNIIHTLSNNVQIIDNFNDKEINIDDALRILDEYCFFQADKVQLELIEGTDKITISLECWVLQSDYNSYTDVMIFSLNPENEKQRSIL